MRTLPFLFFEGQEIRVLHLLFFSFNLQVSILNRQTIVSRFIFQGFPTKCEWKLPKTNLQFVRFLIKIFLLIIWPLFFCNSESLLNHQHTWIWAQILFDDSLKLLIFLVAFQFYPTLRNISSKSRLLTVGHSSLDTLHWYKQSLQNVWRQGLML